eukprot:scaffold137787_cov31-Attheya_sp.AAC.1
MRGIAPEIDLVHSLAFGSLCYWELYVQRASHTSDAIWALMTSFPPLPKITYNIVYRYRTRLSHPSFQQPLTVATDCCKGLTNQPPPLS